MTNDLGLDRAPVEFQKLVFLRPPKYSYITLTYIYFQKNCSIIQYIYILSSSFSYQVHFKNITYVGSMWFEAVFVFFCICVSVYLQF